MVFGVGVSVGVSVVVLEEDSLVCEVASKGDSGDTETGEGALESVPAREGAGVSPGLAVGLRQREEVEDGGWGGRTIWPRGRCGAGQRQQQTFGGRNQ